MNQKLLTRWAAARAPPKKVAPATESPGWVCQLSYRVLNHVQGETMFNKSIKVSIEGTGTGTDALTKKEGVDGLTVSFENEPPAFLSWKSFKQLLSYRTLQGPRPEPKPAILAATPANGPVAVK